jgi:hypothetical protein
VNSAIDTLLISLEKVACGAFSDISFVAGREKRDFRGLPLSVSASQTGS